MRNSFKTLLFIAAYIAIALSSFFASVISVAAEADKETGAHKNFCKAEVCGELHEVKKGPGSYSEETGQVCVNAFVAEKKASPGTTVTMADIISPPAVFERMTLTVKSSSALCFNRADVEELMDAAKRSRGD